jgi:CRISPR type III-B/RAMP module RAMP protein Cmr6
MINLFSWLFYDLINRLLEQQEFPYIIWDKKLKNEFILKNFNKLQEFNPINILDPNKFDKHISNFISNDPRVVAAYYVDIETIYPGLMVSIGNYVFPLFENGIYFDIFSNEPAIPESEIKGAVSRVLSQYYCTLIDKDCYNKLKRLKIEDKKRKSFKDVLIQELCSELKEILEKLKKNNHSNSKIKIELEIPKIILLSKYQGSSNKSEPIIDFDVFTPHIIRKIDRTLNEILSSLNYKEDITNIEFVNPLPIKLFKITPGQRFRIYIIIREEKLQLNENNFKREISKLDHLDVLSLIFMREKLKKNEKVYLNKELWYEILRYALEIEGLGAHTAYGYGRFRLVSNLESILDSKR